MTSTLDENTNIGRALLDYDTYPLCPLDFNEFDRRVASATHLEELWEIVVLIYDELSMMRHSVQLAITGFETNSYSDLRYHWGQRGSCLVGTLRVC